LKALYLQRIRPVFIFENTAGKNGMFFAHNAEVIKSIGSRDENTAVNDAITPFMILPADG
jgi:hypothetical protein